MVTARPPLSRPRILREALALIDAGGLPALSMRRLGAALGVEAMSLYNHVPSKEALLSGVADLLIGMVEVPEPGSDWRVDAHGICRAVREVALAHPRAFPLVVTNPRAELDAWRPVLAGFGYLERLGLSAADAMTITDAVTSYVIGFVLLEINGLMALSSDSEAAYAVDDPSEEHATLRRYLQAAPEQTADDAFHAGLDVILSGVEVAVARTT